MKSQLLIIFASFFVCLSNGGEIYEGYEEDRKLLRDIIEIPSDANLGGKFTSVSSPKAFQAAQRLFSKIPFLFKTRKDVIQVLGDPATISDYGVASTKGVDADLVYRFDSGYGGYEYKLKFINGSVRSVEVISLN